MPLHSPHCYALTTKHLLPPLTCYALTPKHLLPPLTVSTYYHHLLLRPYYHHLQLSTYYHHLLLSTHYHHLLPRTYYRHLLLHNYDYALFTICVAQEVRLYAVCIYWLSNVRHAALIHAQGPKGPSIPIYTNPKPSLSHTSSDVAAAVVRSARGMA